MFCHETRSQSQNRKIARRLLQEKVRLVCARARAYVRPPARGAPCSLCYRNDGSSALVRVLEGSWGSCLGNQSVDGVTLTLSLCAAGPAIESWGEQGRSPDRKGADEKGQQEEKGETKVCKGIYHGRGAGVRNV